MSFQPMLNNPGMNPMLHANSAAQGLYHPHKYQERPPRKFEAIVMENREHSDGNLIRVLITELLPFTKGHARNNPVPLKDSFPDARGRIRTVRATHNNNITAEYFSTDSFRKTPPDVQRGERVHVWQKGDTDIWYWEPINHDSMLRRHLETVVHSVNADHPGVPDSQKHDADHTYYTEMSSHNQTYTISTSQKNNEFARYLIQINAKDGSVVIKDDIGNHIELDSKNTKIWMRNACNTEVTCVENNIKVHCNEYHNTTVGLDKTVEVGRDMVIRVKNDQTTEVTGNNKETIDGTHDKLVRGTSKDVCNDDREDHTDGNYTCKVVGDSTYTHDSNVTITVSGNYTLNVKGEMVIECPMITLKGNTKIEGNLEVTGSTTLGSGGSVTGDLSVQGNHEVQGQVILNGGTTKQPITEG